MIDGWPTRQQRELWEIERFIEHYRHLTGSQLTVVSRGEKPDFVVKDARTGEELGVELTSVYTTDDEVPTEHIPPGDGELPFSQKRVGRYQARLVEAIMGKAERARKTYDSCRPLILSVYANGHDSIFVDWEDFLGQLHAQIRSIHPFKRVLFWPLPVPMPENKDSPLHDKAVFWAPSHKQDRHQ